MMGEKKGPDHEDLDLLIHSLRSGGDNQCNNQELLKQHFVAMYKL
jgi:hypothetical protein